MIWEHGDAMTLLIIARSLIWLAPVMGFESDITFNYTTDATTTIVDNQYSQSALDFRKSPNERVGNMGSITSPGPHNRDDNHWKDHSSRPMSHVGWQSTIDTERRNNNHAKPSFDGTDKSRLLGGEFVIDDSTNFSMTKPLSTEILGDYNNGLKIVQYPDQGSAEDSRLQQQQLLTVKRRRQLSSSITSAQKIIEDYRYIEVKDSPDSRITPISLLDMDYDNRDGEEFYEEMDELLKLKRMLDHEKSPKSNEQKQRGDMNPMLSSPITISNKEKMPIRGDIGTTRHKRFSHDDELWGFAEDEGYVSSVEVETSTAIPTSTDYSANESPRRVHDNQSMKLKIEREKKLLDYIVRNRPIVLPYRTANDKRRNYRPVYSSGNDESLYSVYDRRNHDVMEQRQSADSTSNYDDLEKLSREEARINKIPVSARIIITRDPFFHSKSSSSSSTTTLPPLFSRGNFDNDIVFPEISPDHSGLVAVNFPAPQTESPLKMSPSACVWGIIQCCPNYADNQRLTKCFEYMGCPGVNWDPNPCRREIMESARAEAINYYASAIDQ